MLFDLKMINKIMGDVVRVKIEDDIIDCKPPGGRSVVAVFDVLKKPMTIKQIAEEAKLSTVTVALVLRFMRHYGDVSLEGNINTPTGNTKMFDEYKSKVCKSNTGLRGVTYVKSTNTFHGCYGRKISFTYNNLLDAACKRLSLENQFMERSTCQD